MNSTKIGTIIKNYIIPILTALSTAILGYLTFYIETDLKIKNNEFEQHIKSIETELQKRDQDLKERIAEVDEELKRRDQDLRESLSVKDYELKIYNTVVEALKENQSSYQEAAEGLVLVMIEREPLRSSLLRVLAEKGTDETRNRAKRIVEAERIFKEQELELKKEVRLAKEFNWEETDFSILWCESSSQPAEIHARAIKSAL